MRGFPGDTVVIESTCTAGDIRDMGSIPGSGRSPGGGNGNPLQHCCLENSMDRGNWWATVYGAARGRTWLSTRAQTFMRRVTTEDCFPSEHHRGWKQEEVFMPLASKHLPVIPETRQKLKIQLLTPKRKPRAQQICRGNHQFPLRVGRILPGLPCGSGASILYPECQLQVTLKFHTERLLYVSQHLWSSICVLFCWDVYQTVQRRWIPALRSKPGTYIPSWTDSKILYFFCLITWCGLSILPYTMRLLSFRS